MIRPLRDDDLDALADMWVASWRATLPDIDFDARRDWFGAHIAKLRASGAQVWVAEATGALAGFITIDPASGNIDQLAVGVAHFGGGLARALLAKAKDVAPARLKLCVTKANARALRFYEREGFAKVGEGVNAQSGLGYWEMERSS